MATDAFGKYTIVRRLSRGGMAEIFLAKLRGAEGFEKVLVLKRILPQLAANDELKTMFFDEARLAASLNHPNIVQIYELGMMDGLPFIAMEFIEGLNLAVLMEQSIMMDQPMPLDHVLKIILDVCDALHYAHNKRAANGTPLHLIHRDVSPQNVIVSLEGTVKLLDFGIAKARTNLAETQAGVVKGKYRYMSPEQCRADRLDHRSDIFSVGLLLFEMTTGSPFFDGESDVAIISALLRGHNRDPLDLRADYPPALRKILLKALAYNKEERFQDAEAFRRTLEEFTLRSGLVSNSVSLSRYMRKMNGLQSPTGPTPRSEMSTSPNGPPRPGADALDLEIELDEPFENSNSPFETGEFMPTAVPDDMPELDEDFYGFDEDESTIQADWSTCVSCGSPVPVTSLDRGVHLCQRCMDIQKQAAARNKGGQWWIRSPRGAILGPYSLAELRQHAAGGLSPGSAVSSDRQEWKPYDQWPDLKDPRQAETVFPREDLTARKGILQSKLAWIALLSASLLVLVVVATFLIRRAVEGTGVPEQGVPTFDRTVGALMVEWRKRYADVPAEGSAYMSLGQRFMRQGTVPSADRAARAFEIVLSKAGQSQEALDLLIEAAARAAGEGMGLAHPALALLEPALERSPSSPGLNRAKAMVALAQRDMQAAQTAAAEALRLSPSDPESLVVSGLASMDGNLTQAKAHFTSALSMDSSHPGALRGLVTTFLREGDVTGAMEILQKRGTTPDAVGLQAEVEALCGRFKEARDILIEGSKQYPEAVELRLAEAVLAYQVLDDRPAAMAILQELDPFMRLNAPLVAPAAVAHHRALIQREEGKVAEAEMEAKRALGLQPWFEPARLNLGLLAMLQGQLDRADEELRHLGDVKPVDPLVPLLLGYLADKRSQSADAEVYLKKSLEMDPQSSLASVALFLHYYRQNHRTDATAALWQLLKGDPNHEAHHRGVTDYYPGLALAKALVEELNKGEADPSIRTAQGVLLYRAGQMKEAGKALDKAFELDPTNMVASVYAAAVDMDHKAHDRALSRLRKIFEVAPDCVAALLLSGEAHLGKGKLSDAEKAFRAALAQSDEVASAYLGLARVASRKNDAKGTRYFLEKALALDQHDQRIYLELRGLKGE